MIVTNLEKNKKDYVVTIDDNEYLFDEEVILEFRLVKGKELDEEILNKAIRKNALIKYYNKALDYSIKYGKSKKATKEYLLQKGLKLNEAIAIVDELEKKNFINDNKLIDSIIYSLINSGNGTLLIRNKLFEKGFSSELIDEKLENIDYDLYFDNLKKLYEKALIKYNKEANEYIKIIKIKKYLLSRGYKSSEIIDILE